MGISLRAAHLVALAGALSSACAANHETAVVQVVSRQPWTRTRVVAREPPRVALSVEGDDVLVRVRANERCERTTGARLRLREHYRAEPSKPWYVTEGVAGAIGLTVGAIIAASLVREATSRSALDEGGHGGADVAGLGFLGVGVVGGTAFVVDSLQAEESTRLRVRDERYETTPTACPARALAGRELTWTPIAGGASLSARTDSGGAARFVGVAALGEAELYLDGELVRHFRREVAR